ncbi:MAG: hypothetical protein LBG58_15955 [Planctomycetaceae bacterium]|jgi:hypothetical protein|nr:hypothetical protein [Planctomycetaceae bacterium]
MNNGRIVQFYDISEWQEKSHYQTGGTRNKNIVENIDGGLYYFKTSLERSNNSYQYEFWSEIIASRVGAELGFATLHYDIAWYKEKIGCHSKSMVDVDKNVLSEIVKYLCSYDNAYNPNSKESYSQYTFGFIEESLRAHNLIDKIQCIIETIIFDSLIGNGDRHQENWGFIVPDTLKSKEKRVNKKSMIDYFKVQHRKTANDIGIVHVPKIEFAPIYDSGSCLGRELLDVKVEQMLKDNQMLDAYLSRDRCEVRWEGAKMSHFDLIARIMTKQLNYRKVVTDKIEQVTNLFSVERIQKIIFEIDKHLPVDLSWGKLPSNRKQFMFQLISLRLGKLKEFIK